ncbi:MAG: hypothetical protein GY755_05840 [Chloroflexi bacterium]|nr:hypothetical protein [Chloroflexota bacterium]
MIKKIINWLMPKKKKMEENAAMTANFLKMLEMTKEDEHSCSDVYELLDQFVELKMRGADVEKIMPKVKHHLDMCKDCFEEYEALMAALEFETSA